MSWSTDTDYDIILTDNAKSQVSEILDYIFFTLKNPQAALDVEQDMKETSKRLTHIAGSLKLCDDPKLRELGYHTIHLKRHNYFMLYKIMGKQVFIMAVYHDLQDYESLLR